MSINSKYISYTWFIFVMVFLVIAAGGVVRMTQSGMGCPDWPTCFGRWIPPLSEKDLPPDFEKYLGMQDIDHSFNVYHTWIEYINRLLGALLGVFIIIHFVWSYRKYRKSNRQIVIISLLLLIAVVFQGWLGKKVVDDNLAVVKVTIHMLVALFIAALPLVIIYKLRSSQRVHDIFLKWYSVVVLTLLLLQVILGTRVREQIDEISKPLKYTGRDLWIERLGNNFFMHRSFSWLVLGGCLLLCMLAWKYAILRRNAIAIILLSIAAISLGIIMAWYNIPAIAQPLHLLVAAALVMSVLTLRLRVK